MFIRVGERELIALETVAKIKELNQRGTKLELQVETKRGEKYITTMTVGEYEDLLWVGGV